MVSLEMRQFYQKVWAVYSETV